MRLGIGTVQFGLDYGITNRSGQVPESSVGKILEFARASDITIIDTAPTYGSSEEVIGRQLPSNDRFKIVTKTLPLKKKSGVTSQDAKLIRTALLESLSKLRLPSIYGLLVHDPQDLLNPGADFVFSELQKLKRDGLVEKIGVSVYTGTEIDQITQQYPIDMVQLPLNVLDQRLVASGHLAKLKKLNIEVHARSPFLQGILLLEPKDLPAQLAPLQTQLEAYHAFLSKHALSPAQGSLNFISQLNLIDHLIVGVLSVEQLMSLSRALIHPAQAPLDYSPFACANLDMIDPRRWLII